MKKWIPILLLVALVGGQLGMIIFNVRSTNRHNELTNVPPRPENLGTALTFETIMPYAQRVANTWQPDAQLVSASMQIDWPEEFDPIQEGGLPPGGWILLGFVSGDEILTMRIDRGSGTIVQNAIIGISKSETDTYASHAIDFNQAAVTSVTAATAFEVSNGERFRQACPQNRGQSFIRPELDTASGNWVWDISYIDRPPNQDVRYMTGQIDWRTGQQTNVKNTDLTCVIN
ncbi:MAG TPA: hypothetical protein PK819_01335 [Thermomicrobiales bacterium]|nr:hypothetical protein [Thermomicrobiales bacterium]